MSEIINPNNIKVAEWTPDGLILEEGKVVRGNVSAEIVESKNIVADNLGATTAVIATLNSQTIAVTDITAEVIKSPTANLENLISTNIQAETMNVKVIAANELTLSDSKAGINTLTELTDKIKESLGKGRGDMIVFTAPGTAIILSAPSEPNMILVSEPSTETGLQWKRITEVIGQ